MLGINHFAICKTEELFVSSFWNEFFPNQFLLINFRMILVSMIH